MEKKLFLVSTTVGEWDDAFRNNDSIWDNIDDANKRVEILKRENLLKEHQKDKCWNCPINLNYHDYSLNNVLEWATKYCKEHCNGIGKPFIDTKYKDVCCYESSQDYQSVTVNPPEAVDFNNQELLINDRRTEAN